MCDPGTSSTSEQRVATDDLRALKQRRARVEWAELVASTGKFELRIVCDGIVDHEGTTLRTRVGVAVATNARPRRKTEVFRRSHVETRAPMTADLPGLAGAANLGELKQLEFRDLLDHRFPHPMQSVVFPLIAMRHGEVHLRGTAFSIGGNLALTATHVVDRADGLQEASLLHVEPGPETGQVHARLLPIVEVTAHEDQTDVAVLRLDVPVESGRPFRLRPLHLGVAPPGIGERIAFLGYAHRPPMGTIDEVLTLRPKLHISDGTVVELTPAGGPVCRVPSFRIDARLDEQMSGGPVLASMAGGLLAVRGVACSGAAVAEGVVPYAYASMTFTAMALDPVVDAGDGPAATYLYDLAKLGHVPVVDLNLVEFDRSDPAHPRLAIRSEDDA